ncbi:PBSX family phage terminase large subunit [Faecalibacterium sp. i25-0019-C1]|uniref:phage terminase large subunit n=1 Tax=Faecalibacterium sp. i25-0019-C1 TaxID=3141185 RepID=UPI0036F2343C
MNIPAPFSQNQMRFFWNCFDHWFNVAEGGKRGGKNVLITMAYCTILEKHPSRIHLIAGVSTATARLNILDCDGFGLKNYFEGRCREGTYQNRDCLYIQTATGEKVVLVSGGGKAGDEKLIKGNTYGTAYITEVNECSEAFIQEVFDRTLSSPDRKVFHDLNPKAEGHWYYKTILDFHEAKQRENPDYGLNYGHFTIADNMSISDDRLRAVLATYDRKSIWYARDILGQRRAAEGLIYDMFDRGRNVFKLGEEPIGLRSVAVRWIGVDYGTRNDTVLLEAYDDGNILWITREYRWTSRRERKQKTDEEYADDFMAFMGESYCATIIDPSAASFIEALRRRGVYVMEADNDVLNGIRRVSTLMSRCLLKICSDCKGTIDELESYHWDDKAALVGIEKPIKEDDHGCDVVRYLCNTAIPHWRYGE